MINPCCVDDGGVGACTVPIPVPAPRLVESGGKDDVNVVARRVGWNRREDVYGDDKIGR